MMRAFKKMIALIMATLICLPLLVACADKDGESGSDTIPSVSFDDLMGGGSADLETPTVAFDGDFTVKGESAELFLDLLERKGISTGETDSAKTVYVGKADTELTAQAKAFVDERENNYSDYAVIYGENAIALYGGSEYATELAVEHLLGAYASDGAIRVPEDMSVFHKADTVSATLGSANIKDCSVYAAQDGCEDIARTLAECLSAVSGYRVPVSDKLVDNCVSVKVESTDGEDDFSVSYEVKGSISRVNVTAATRASLSYAVRDFSNGLEDGEVISSGYSEQRNFDMKHYDAADTELFKYCGMWQATDPSDPTAMVSYWNAPYVEICFEGNAVTLEFSQRSIFRISVDGGEYSDEVVCDDSMTVYAEGDGDHTVRIYNQFRDRHVYFSGASAEKSVRLSRAEEKPIYIQFVGDSISDNRNSFSHRVGDELGWDFSVTAVGGMALGSEQGFWHVNNGYDRGAGAYVDGSMADLIFKNTGKKTVAMEEAFFKLGHPTNNMSGYERELYAEKYFTPTLDCDFSMGYTPDVVFIFLGTNDELYSEATFERFYASYLSFVTRILETYGSDTKICIMQRVSNGTADHDTEIPAYEVIRRTADMLVEQYPDNVHFIDRDVLSGWNVEISSDKIHPTTAGYDTLTEKLSKYLKDLYG